MNELEYLEVEHGSEDYWATVELRRKVLRVPLGLDFTREELAREQSDYHLVCGDDRGIVACLVLTSVGDDVVRIRQVAVTPPRQGQGIGGALTLFAEDFARMKGFKTVILHARAMVTSFYEKLGYERVGEEFEEVTIPHWEMRKKL
jgi:predicted GNAT family N-acyltransferase